MFGSGSNDGFRSIDKKENNSKGEKEHIGFHLTGDATKGKALEVIQTKLDVFTFKDTL